MSKRLLVLFTFILFIVPLANVNAQTFNGIDYCQHLSADDCAIVNQSSEIMSQVNSLSFEIVMDFGIGLEGEDMPAGMDSLAINLAGNGMLAMDFATIANMQELATADMDAYLEQFPGMFDQFLASMNGEVHMLISLPEMMAMMTDGVSEIPINLLMKDGVFAFDLGALEGATGEGTGAPQWMGIDMTGAFSSMMDEMMGDFDLSSMMGGDMMAVNNPEFMSEFATITRLPDGEVGGEAVAVFQTTLDFGAMFKSPEMLEAMGAMDGGIGIDEMSEIADVASMFEGTQFVVNEHIGLDSHYVRRVDMSMNFAMDGEMMGDASGDAMSFDFDFAINLSDFNSPVNVEIPSEAMVLPFEMLMGSGF